MTRPEIKKYYESKISDIADENTRDKLLDRLEEIDDILFELDTDIDTELENQSVEYIDEFGLADEFNYSCRMPLGEMRGL